AGKIFRGWLAGHPVRGFAVQFARQQPLALHALIDEQDVARDILADHEPGRSRPAFDAADMQAFALAKGVVENTAVLADLAAIDAADLAGFGGNVLAEEFAEIAFADETDAGGILFLRGRKCGRGGEATDFALGQVADR